MANRNRRQRPWTYRDLDIRTRLRGRERDHVGDLTPASNKKTTKMRTGALFRQSGDIALPWDLCCDLVV